MAPTMKHRRSARKRKLKRASDRYDKTLSRFKRLKKKGGSIFTKNSNGKKVLPHRVSKDNPVYNGVKVVRTED